jgi:hypothetical protein
LGFPRLPVVIGIILGRQLDADNGLPLCDHSFGGARFKAVCRDRKIPRALDHATELRRPTIVVSSNRYRNIPWIEIYRIAKEHDLNRRDQEDQRNGRGIVNKMQHFDASH